MESLEQYDEYLKARLSQKRYIHSKNVSEASVMLAKKFGGTDVEPPVLPVWYTIFARKNRKTYSAR